MKQRRNVGRVGALAVLLGVGMGVGPISGLSPTAVADTSDSAASADPASPAPARQHRGPRAASAARSERRGSNAPGSAASVAAPRRAQPMAATPDPTVQIEVATVRVADSVAAQPVPAAIAVQAGERGAAPSAVPAAASVPVVTAPQAVAATGSLTALAVLGGGSDPLAPLAAPFSWATLAVTRRELSRATSAALPAISAASSEPVPSPLTDLLAQPGAKTALLGAAKQFVLAVAGGGNTEVALQRGIRALEDNPIFADLSFNAVLTDPALPQAVGSATASVITGLAADPDVRAAVGAALSDYLGPALGGLPPSIGPSVANAAIALLADPAAGKALGAVAGSAVSVFLGQPGVLASLAGVAGEVQDVVAGRRSASALDSVWESIQSDSAVRAGVVAAVGAGVNTALTDSGLVAALGTTASTLVNDLAADPATWTYVTQALGPTYGNAVTAMLSDPTAAGHLADTAASVLTGFLGQPGVVGALSGVAGQFAGAVFGGADSTAALNGALGALQASAAFSAAVDDTISVALHAILGDSGVQDAVGAVAKQVVASLITGSSGASSLRPIVGKLLAPAVDSLLGNSAVQNLIGDIAPAIVTGTPVSDITATVVQAVFDQPALQAAVGAAVGQAVGSLIGDNPIGNLVAKSVGRSVTRLIHTVARLAPLLTRLGVKIPGMAAAEHRSTSSVVFVLAAG
jgi:hypothetical protein